MAMAWIWTGMAVVSVVCGAVYGRMEAVSAAALEGAGQAVRLCLSMAGVLCLWTGLMEVMDRCGLSRRLGRLFRPVLRRLLKDGCLTTHDQAVDGRIRRYYHITPPGRMRLDEALRDWAAYRDSIEKVFFGG